MDNSEYEQVRKFRRKRNASNSGKINAIDTINEKFFGDFIVKIAHERSGDECRIGKIR